MKPGTDADGIAQTEADHRMKCPGCGQWFDKCAISPRSSRTSTIARLKFWRGQSHRLAKAGTLRGGRGRKPALTCAVNSSFQHQI
jgi:hypothetical protein